MDAYKLLTIFADVADISKSAIYLIWTVDLVLRQNFVLHPEETRR
jgi:hypothetical protein